MNSGNGEMLIQIPQSPNVTYMGSVHAYGGVATLPTLLYEAVFEFQPADTSDTSNGPWGRDCVGGTDQRVDEVEFDGRYAQRCSVSLCCSSFFCLGAGEQKLVCAL